jgi:hypothetical protein
MTGEAVSMRWRNYTTSTAEAVLENRKRIGEDMATLAEIRRARFERELCLYSIETYNAPRIARALGKRVVDQPVYMPELRALYMAVRETYKVSMPKGADIDHMWPREVGAKKKIKK